MASWGFPSWRDDLDIDYTSLPTRGKKMVRMPVRQPDGSIREVIMEEGINPEEIIPPEPKAPPSFGQTFMQRSGLSGLADASRKFQENFNISALEPFLPPGPFGDIGRGGVQTLRGVGAAVGALPAFIGATMDNPDITPQDAIGATLKGMEAGGEALPSTLTPLDIAGVVPGKVGALAGAADALLGLGDLSGGIQSGDPLSASTGVARIAGGTFGALNPGRLNLLDPNEIPELAGNVNALARSMGYTDAPGLSRMAPEGPKKLGPVSPIEEMIDVYHGQEGTSGSSGGAWTRDPTRARTYGKDVSHVRIPKSVFEAGNKRGVELGNQFGPMDTWLEAEHIRGAKPFEVPDQTIAAQEVKPLERQSLFEELGITEYDPITGPKAGAGADVPDTARIGELERIIASDAPVDVRLQAMMELEDMVPPEVKTGITEAKTNVGRPAGMRTSGPVKIYKIVNGERVEIKPPETPKAALDEAIANHDVDGIRRAGTEMLKNGEITTHEISDLMAAAEYLGRKKAPPKPKPVEKDIDTVFKELDESTAAQEKADEGKFRVDVHYQTGGGYQREGAFNTVEEALNASRGFDDAKGVRVLDPEGKAHYVKGAGPETIARRTIPEAAPPKKPTQPEIPAAPPESPILKSINDVYDQTYGKGVRLKAAQLREGREVWNELKKRKELPTQEDLSALLAERSGGKTPAVEAPPEVPPKEPTASLEVQLRVAERQGKWSEVERLKGEIKKADVAREGEAKPEYTEPPLEPSTKEPFPSFEQYVRETERANGRTSTKPKELRRLRQNYESLKAQDARKVQDISPEVTDVKERAALEARKEELGPEGMADLEKKTMAKIGMEGEGPLQKAAKTPSPVNPLVKKITEAAPTENLRPVNPVKVLTGEVPEPKPVAPVKAPKVIKDVDTVSAKVEKETGVSPDKPPQLDTKEGKAFVKSLAKNLGVTEDVAARMVGGQTVPGPQGTKATVGQGTPTAGAPGKIVPRAGKNVPAASGGGPSGGQPPPASTTPRLPPIKGKRPTLDILSWMRQRRSGDVLAEQTRRRFESTPKGVQAQLDFESGKLNLPKVRAFLDRQHKLMRRAGVDVGYVENYLTHLWKESPSQVRKVLGKRLGLKPGIAMTRSIPTLAEGIQKGLTPKFENMSDVLSWYSRSVNKAIADRGFFEWLREQKQIKAAGKAPHDWVTLDPDRFPIRKWKGNTVQFKAPKDMAVKINEYLYDPASDPRTFVQGLQKASRFSSFLKNIRLAAGVPFTKLNMHSFSVMAHHVLTTPTVKGIPNIPRMIGRGLKDFGEMLDPRLHKWTNEELSRAHMMQKYGPLTLSTEDHVFAPAIKGTLLKRIKEAKNPSQLFSTITSRMFEEPLFQSHLPKMKLNVAWELQKEYRKGGMGRRQAMEAAGEVTNNMFGGLNLDEMGRNKMAQDLARILVLAPDWLESNLRTTKAVLGSPLGRTPKEKTYRDFGTNLLGAYVAGTFLQKALTGRWMHENNPGNQFSIYLGKNPSNGKDRYVKPFGAGLAGVRLIYDSAEAVARREDVGKFGELTRGRMAIPAGIGLSTIFNKGPFGQPIAKKSDTLGGQLRSVGEFAAGQVVPQYVAGPVAALKGNISPELGLAQSIEFPYTEVKRRAPDEKKSTGRSSQRRRHRR